MYSIRVIHFQLTDRCPLSCKQCYCNADKGKDIPIAVLEERVRQAAEIGVKAIALGGGEPLIYPELIKAIKIIKHQGIRVHMATSGYGLTVEFLQEIFESGLDELTVSINGSNDKIHNYSRSHFEVALNALKVCNSIGKTCSINWVAQKSNCYDFPDVVKLAEANNVKQINLILLKPDSHRMLDEMFDKDQLLFLYNYIKNYRGSILKFSVQNCFSTLKLLIYGDKNTGEMRGCGAGKILLAVDNEGKLYPCRHLLFTDEYSDASICEYLDKSEHLKLFLESKSRVGRCSMCKFRLNCLPCFSVGYEIFKNLDRCADLCLLFEKV